VSAGLEARGLVAGYGERVVLRGIDLAVSAGERVALIGPNGAGKTTALRCLAGVLRPRAGTVALDDRSLTAIRPRDRARRIAVVPQVFVTPFAFTAREVVALGRTPYLSPLGRLAQADHAAITRAMGETECLEVADRPFSEISAGERQRVVLAMALAQESDVLLLDEPVAHLDLAHQYRTLGLVERLARARGIAVVAALHDLALAAARFDRLVALDAGRLAADGPGRAVLTRALLRDVFDVDADVRWEDGTATILPTVTERDPVRSPG